MKQASQLQMFDTGIGYAVICRKVIKPWSDAPANQYWKRLTERWLPFCVLERPKSCAWPKERNLT